MLSGQVAIITGSGQGIGAEAARMFAREGAKVTVQDTDAGDVLDLAHIETLVRKAAEFGQGKIHIIVNNAGFTWDAVIHKMTDKQWDTILALHNTAPFRLVRAAAPYFRIKDGASRCIINNSSTSGVNGNAGQANYGLAKAGVTGLTKGPQFEVRANTVAFGHIQTRLTAAKEEGAFVTTPDGTKVPLGISKAQKDTSGDYSDIPLRRPGTAIEAARASVSDQADVFVDHASQNGTSVPWERVGLGEWMGMYWMPSVIILGPLTAQEYTVGWQKKYLLSVVFLNTIAARSEPRFAGNKLQRAIYGPRRPIRVHYWAGTSSSSDDDFNGGSAAGGMMTYARRDALRIDL
ncbi:MAG: hypothetical protein Q9177_005945 [Variospora cf. flavescens]